MQYTTLQQNLCNFIAKKNHIWDNFSKMYVVKSKQHILCNKLTYSINWLLHHWLDIVNQRMFSSPTAKHAFLLPTDKIIKPVNWMKQLKNNKTNIWKLLYMFQVLIMRERVNYDSNSLRL